MLKNYKIEINSEFCKKIFNESILDYHKKDNINADFINIYPENTIEALLYYKCWIDTVQWHLEDIIRDPTLDNEEIVKLKRWIDRQNQKRTDTVEKIDDRFLNYFKDCERKAGARMNSESPAWIVDRLSILCLKIYHMKEQYESNDRDEKHRERVGRKLQILLEQCKDLSQCLDELLEDISLGIRYMKVYRQMKMYNDETLNPLLKKKSPQDRIAG